MFVKRFFSYLVSFIVKCLITPIFISIGVVLFLALLSFSKLSYINAAVNMLVFVEGETDKQIYEQLLTPIDNKQVEEPTETNIVYPLYGEKFAELTIEKINMLDKPVFNCDDYAQLKFGWGHSFFTRYPGEGGKIVIAGHLVKYRDLLYVGIGNEVKLRTKYGIFYYKITEKYVVDGNDTKTMAPDDSKEKLVLYICNPNGVLGTETQRFIVECELVKGPKILNLPFKE